jgi:hypothetical protein
MNADIHLEHRASSSQGKHEGEPSLGLCDRLDRTRDNSQRQLPTDHDYAVPTREYQTDQSSLKTAPTAARSVFGKRKRKPPKQSHRSRPVDTVTPYQAESLIDQRRHADTTGNNDPNILRSSRATRSSLKRDAVPEPSQHHRKGREYPLVLEAKEKAAANLNFAAASLLFCHSAP